MAEWIDAGHKDSSEPPAIITLAFPSYIKWYESPIAEAPVAQAVEAVPMGP